MISSLQEIESKWEQMKYQMHRQGDLCRLQIIGSILYGEKRDEAQILEQLSTNSIDLCGAGYDVCVVELEQPAGADSEISNEFCKYLEECALREGEKRFAIPLNEHNVFACILVSDDADGRQASIAGFFSALKEGLSDGISITMGVGNTAGSIGGIAAAFNEARNALQHAFLLGRKRVILIDEVRSGDSGELVWYPVQIEEGLIRGLTMGDAGFVREKLDDLEMMLRNAHALVNVSRSILLGVIKRLADTLSAEGNLQARADMVHISVMLSNSNITLAETVQEMDRVLEKACADVQPRALKKENLSEKVNSYLRMNMGNDQLTLSNIADVFGLSSGHFSRLYKQETDMTVMQKLDEIRLEAAEKLIRETYISLDEIIARCGYNDKGNFIRKFKREYTVPPMRYREMHQRHEK